MALEFNENGLSVPEGELAVRQQVSGRWVEQWPDARTDPDSTDGKIITVVTLFLTLIYNTILMIYRGYKSGVELDRALALFGAKRMTATPSTARCTFYGTDNTVVTTSTQVLNESGDSFLTSQGITLSDNQINVFVGGFRVLGELDDGNDEYVMIGGTQFSSTQSGVSNPVHASDIATQINATFSEIRAQAVNDVVLFESLTGGIFWLVSLNGSSQVDILGVAQTLLTSEVMDSLSVESGSLSRLGSAISGVDGVSNIVAGTVGNKTETDQEFLDRHINEIGAPGRSYRRGIGVHLLKSVPGVEFVRIYNNRSDVTDSETRPPHSVEAVVMGGVDQDIYEQLVESVAGGIQMYGRVDPVTPRPPVTVTSEDGVSDLVSFTRPRSLYLWLEIEITEGEDFPVNSRAESLEAVKIAVYNNLIAGGNYVLEVGRDFHSVEAVHRPAAASITGIANISVGHVTKTSPTSVPTAPEYSTSPSLTVNEIDRLVPRLQSITVTSTT